MASQTGASGIVSDGAAYLSIVCGCSFGLFGQFLFERLLQATGRTIFSMITQSVGAVINIILDPILIFGLLGAPKMGVAGAAAATVIGQTAAALTIEQADAPFAFSALPNTAQEIEAAQHITELPATGRTSVTILGAARGVGGIDSWGTDVEEPYRVSGEGEHRVAFRIVL